MHDDAHLARIEAMLREMRELNRIMLATALHMSVVPKDRREDAERLVEGTGDTDGKEKP